MFRIKVLMFPWLAKQRSGLDCEARQGVGGWLDRRVRIMCNLPRGEAESGGVERGRAFAAAGSPSGRC